MEMLKQTNNRTLNYASLSAANECTFTQRQERTAAALMGQMDTTVPVVADRTHDAGLA